MSERIFVRVVGFSDIERHALNTMFRLSEERKTTYAVWTPDMMQAAQVSLVDGQSYEAQLQLETPNTEPDAQLLWVGAISPVHAARTFVRPIVWPDVLQAMDELFSVSPTVDFDLSVNPVTPLPTPQVKRTLIVGADAGERFYLRAKLASVDLLLADEAATAAEVDSALAASSYQVILLDLDLHDANGWELLRRLTAIRPAISVIALTSHAGVGARLRAWAAGAKGCLDKPPHPGKLQALLLAI